nr:MAG TPA: hypothetical protein [Caudoviricetes sp.]
MKAKSIIAAAIIATSLTGAASAATVDTSVPVQDGAKWYVNGTEVHHDGKFWYDEQGNVIYTDVPPVTDNTGSTTTPPTTESTSTNTGSTTTPPTTESTSTNAGTTTTESTKESTTTNTGTTTTESTTESTTTNTGTTTTESTKKTELNNAGNTGTKGTTTQSTTTVAPVRPNHDKNSITPTTTQKTTPAAQTTNQAAHGGVNVRPIDKGVQTSGKADEVKPASAWTPSKGDEISAQAEDFGGKTLPVTGSEDKFGVTLTAVGVAVLVWVALHVLWKVTSPRRRRDK